MTLRHTESHLWLTSLWRPVARVSTSWAMFLARPYFSTSPSQPSLTIMSSRGLPKAARTGEDAMVRLHPRTGVSKSGWPPEPRQAGACPRCFVDGAGGSTEEGCWEHGKATVARVTDQNLMSCHKPRYRNGHDAIHHDKSSVCPRNPRSSLLMLNWASRVAYCLTVCLFDTHMIPGMEAHFSCRCQKCGGTARVGSRSRTAAPIRSFPRLSARIRCVASWPKVV